MTVTRDSATFPVPLTDKFHQAAQGFYQHHGDSQKAKQVYLNTLTVQAVQFYLQCLGMTASLEASESWNPAIQTLANIADLWLPGLGRLECCPILPGQSNWDLPAEVGSDRIGYVFVLLNADLTEATLLGFLPQVAGEQVSLDQLQPIDDFPTYLEQRTATTPTRLSPKVALQQWLGQKIETGWTSLEQLMANWQTQELAFNFRSALARASLIEPATTGAKQGKYLTFGNSLNDQVLFIVGIVPTQQGEDFNITVELYPTNDQAVLPPALQLTVLDEAQMPVLQAEGRQSEGLEFQFSGAPGESFTVQISLNQQTVIEQFEI